MPPAKALKSPKSPTEKQQRTKRRVLVAHACRNGPCRYFVQALILTFLLCAFGLMAYSLHLRLYSAHLHSMSSSPSALTLHDAEGGTAAVPFVLPPLAPLSAVKSRALLLFSVMRDYNPQFAVSSAAEYARYTLALTSWLSLSSIVGANGRSEYSVGRLDVVLFVDSTESCQYVSKTWPSVVCRVSSSLVEGGEGTEGCMHDLPKGSRPYMHCLWRHVANHSHTSAHHYDDIVYVNGDIVLFPSLLDTLTLVHRSYPAHNQSYALVTRRRDAAFTALTAAALAPNKIAATQQLFTVNSSSSSGSSTGSGSQLHDPLGIDAFLLSASLFPSIAVQFPQFLVGSYRWDNWLLATLLRSSSGERPVLDGTEGWLVGHDSVASDHVADEGAEWNDGIVKQLLGKWYVAGTVDNADVRVVKGGGNGSSNGLRLEVSGEAREQLQLYRYISAAQSKKKGQQTADTNKV